MQEYINKLRATVTIEVSGAYPGDLINRLAANNVPFWDVLKEDDLCWRVTMYASDYKKIMIHAKRAMCLVHIVSRQGLPFFTRKFKKRLALIIGIVFFLIAVTTLPKFVWYIEVEGAKEVHPERIIRELDELGVGIGTYGPSIRSVRIKNKLLLEIPELSWMTINVSGGKATVIVRERVEKPEILDESLKTDLVADNTGIITRVEVLRGKTLVEVGQTVLTGELLVSGEILHENNINTFQTVRSMGEIYARTWHELTALMPKTYQKKTYTDETKEKYAVIIGSKRINLYFNSGNNYTSCDKIIEVSELKLPGGISFPISIEKATYSQYETEPQVIDKETADEILKEYLQGLIRDTIGAGEVKLADYNIVDAGEFYMMTLNAECEQQIAQEVPSNDIFSLPAQ